MQLQLRHTLLLLTTLLFTPISFAEQEHERDWDKLSKEEKSVAKDSYKATVEKLKEGRLEQVLRGALETLVQSSFRVLENEGHKDFAAQKSAEWFTSFSIKNKDLANLDLGDHRPLSQWLSDFYVQLEARIPARLIKLFKLDDIQVFNYGLPVSLHPWASFDGGDWGEEEYAEHFVPTAAASVYWIVQQACSLGTPMPYSLACGLAARLPRFLMKHFVAEPISNRVYRSFN